jgi:hypothetical protein
MDGHSFEFSKNILKARSSPRNDKHRNHEGLYHYFIIFNFYLTQLWPNKKKHEKI